MMPATKYLITIGIVLTAWVKLPAQTSTQLSLVDSAALTLTNGHYGNIINGQSFQQDALISYKGWQYITYYNANRHVCIGRRKLPAGQWEMIRFADYRFSYIKNRDNDAHNTISMGLCVNDGTIHLAFDHHGSPLHYRVSTKNVLEHPENIVWEPSLFTPVRDYLETGKPLTSVTYPVFVSTPQGNLLFGHRIGGSSNGNYFIGEYTAGKGWQNIHMVISGRGNYNCPFKGISPSRNGYINGLSFDKAGKLHTSWTWREKAEGAGNRDIAYAYSKDNGRTWYNTLNKKIADEKDSQVIDMFTPGITIKELDRGWGTMNSQSQCADAQGTPHIVMYHNKAHGEMGWARFNKDAAYFHYYRTPTGKWQQTGIPAIGNRPKLVADKKSNLYLVFMQKDHFDFRKEAAPLIVMRATAASKWTDWTEVYTSKSKYFNEPQVDINRLAGENILSVLVQEAPDTVGEATNLNVLDIDVRERSTEEMLRKVADWQIDSIARNGLRFPANDWVYATFYKGLWKVAETFKDSKYWQQLQQYAIKANWKVGTGERRYFADDYCIGEVYCALYKKYKEKVALQDFQQMANDLVTQPHTESLEFKNKVVFREWAWCDALFMGPASLVALSNTTGNKKYLVLMDSLFWKTYAYLYDTTERLYYRDSRFFSQTEKNGAKKFWGRGNGWVLAGLARVLEIMPATYANRPRYEQLFRQMAARIASLQQPDGMWRASLLDPDSYPGKETSGTGLYCYALAVGINQHLLNKKEYYPVVQKAWNALLGCVHDDGKLGYVQRISDKPGETSYDYSDAYGVGGFLLAGTEMLKLEAVRLR